MKKYIIYTALTAAMLLAGCKSKNEVEAPVVGQEITLSFSMASEVQLPNAAAAPLRAATALPGDPGKDDFVAPTNLYFILWVETTGGTKMMAAVQETGLTAADWEGNGKGLYTLKDKSYKLTIPKEGGNVQQLKGGVFHVFAFASTQDLSNVGSTAGISYTAFTAEEKTSGRIVTNTAVELSTLQTLTYAVPAGVTTEAAKSAFFRSMYSTALSETAHNQMATSPTIRLRHTAARLDINWECPTATTGLPDAQTSRLTANSTWTIATTSFPTAFSLFQPGANTGATSWSETITIDEGMRYNGRYVTYLPMPTTPTFTVTSSDDIINPEGATSAEKKVMTFPLAPGADPNYATWLRALWTIK